MQGPNLTISGQHTTDGISSPPCFVAPSKEGATWLKAQKTPASSPTYIPGILEIQEPHLIYEDHWFKWSPLLHRVPSENANSESDYPLENEVELAHP